MFEAIGDEEAKERAKQCRRKAVKARQKAIDMDAVNMKKSESRPSEQEKETRKFLKVRDYRDAEMQAQDCADEAVDIRSSLYDTAVSAMNMAGDESSKWDTVKQMLEDAELDGYRDIAELRIKASKRYEECAALEREAKMQAEERHRREAEAAVAKQKRKFILSCLGVVLVIASVLVVSLVIIPEKNYREAIELQEAGLYEEAITAFEALNGYSDSEAQIEACRNGIKEHDYQAAISLQQAGLYEEAITAFEALNGYSDSAAQIEACLTSIKERDYQAAVSLQKAGKYEEAITAFEALNGYSDSAAQIEACLTGIKEHDYQAAVSLQEAGKFEEAITAFEALKGYSDSAAQIEACLTSIKERDYQAAVSLQEAEKYEEAITAFEALNGYSDSAAQIEACLTSIKERDYQTAISLQEAGKYEEAITAFEALNGYSDSAVQINETKYLKATILTEKGDYAGAVSVFSSIKGYKDVDILLESDKNLSAATAARDAQYSVGNYVTFGHYPQTSEGVDSTLIEWLVVDRDGQKVLLLSRFGLDAQPYNKEYTSITWEECTLRTWLNETFLNKAFTPREQTGILMTNVDNSSGQGYNGWKTSGGNNTQDKVFLLSYSESNKYLGVRYNDTNNTKSRVEPTAYAINQKANIYSNKTADGKAAGWWWLRSPGRSPSFVAVVRSDGAIYYNNADNNCGSVRPALWINLESDIF